MSRFAYVNGRYLRAKDAQVPVEDRGLQFADSVYEVIALINGHLADEHGHLDRLENSLSALSIDMPLSRRSLRAAIRHLVRLNRVKNGGVYIQITRGTARRDFAFPPAAVRPNIVMTVKPATFDIEKRKAAAKKVITVPDIRWKRRDIKTTGLLAQVLAKQTAIESGAHDAWMLDTDGYVTEASASNAWIVTRAGEIITRPPAGNAILNGVTRRALRRLCRESGLKFTERAFTVAEAKKAAEAFMSSAVMLIVPVSHIDGVKIGDGKIGAVTGRLYDLYMEYAKKTYKAQEKWTNT